MTMKKSDLWATLIVWIFSSVILCQFSQCVTSDVQALCLCRQWWDFCFYRNGRILASLPYPARGWTRGLTAERDCFLAVWDCRCWDCLSLLNQYSARVYQLPDWNVLLCRNAARSRYLLSCCWLSRVPKEEAEFLCCMLRAVLPPRWYDPMLICCISRQ